MVEERRLMMKPYGSDNQILSMKSTRAITLLALLIACAVHAVLLLGLRVSSTRVGSWASREALLWITSPKRETPGQAMSLSPGRSIMIQRPAFARTPEYYPNRKVYSYMFGGLLHREMPLVYLSRRGGEPVYEESGPASSAHSPDMQWSISNLAELEKIVREDWRTSLEPVPAVAGEIPGRPVIVALSIDVPGGIRQITVLESSGSDEFDAAACGMLRTLPYTMTEFSTQPGRFRPPRPGIVILAVSLASQASP